MSRASKPRQGGHKYLLQNDDEGEVKHLTRLLAKPPPSEVKVVMWTGRWLCVCGRICWPKQHCKACSQSSPCRSWCFEGGCNHPTCKFPHPSFYLPGVKPGLDAEGKTSDGREVIVLPPPGTWPAVEVVRMKREARPLQALAPQQQQHRIEAGHLAGKHMSKQLVSAPEGHWPPAPPAPSVPGSENGGVPGWGAAAGAGGGWEAPAGGGGQQAAGKDDSDMWAQLVARARAAMDAAHGGAQATPENPAPAPTTATAAGAGLAAAINQLDLGAPAQQPAATASVNWDSVLEPGAQGAPVVTSQEQEDAELQNLLALLCAS